ncbi:MAG: hypothetical protein R3B45_06755 [Bdellovibrionota bacterium]
MHNVKLCFFIFFMNFIFIDANVKAENEVGKVSENEVDQVARRFRSRVYSYFALGPTLLQNSKNDQLSHSLALGYIWDSTPNATTVKAIGEAAGFKSPKTMFWNFSLGANYFFTTANFSFLELILVMVVHSLKLR